MTRALFVFTLLLLFARPCLAETPVVSEVKDAVVLAFRIKVSVPDAGKLRKMEIAPKLIVKNNHEAEIGVDTPDESALSIQVRPRFLGKSSIELALKVTARLGGARVERRARLVTLMGSPALIEFEDDGKRETLTIEVTPTRAP